MRRFNGALALLMALCLISASAFAQDERPTRGGRGGGGGGPGGGGFGGGFGGFGRGGMTQGGASELLGLLRMEEVRKEVKVSNESYEAVQTAQREVFGKLREASEEERTKIMKDMNVKAQEYLDELVDPAGMKRLMGLLLQQQGQSAATNELIAKEIGLKDPELKAVTDVVAKTREEGGTKMREAFAGGGFGGGGGAPDPERMAEMRKKMTELTAEMRKTSDAAVNEKLTADQKKAIETLKGEKFTFPEMGGFGGGRGGPGGGRGGAGGGRTRPGSDN